MILAVAIFIVGLAVTFLSLTLPKAQDADDRRRPTPVGYRILVGVLIGFGFLGILSIGMPFLLIGLTLAPLGNFRHRPAVFWPPLIAVSSLVAGFIVTAPITCSHSSESVAGGTTIEGPCSNLVGIDYSGSGGGHPSLVPALLVGLAAAATLGTLSRAWLARTH